MLIVAETINIHVPYLYEVRPPKLDLNFEELRCWLIVG